MSYSMKDMMKLTGVSNTTLKRYEALELIPEVGRKTGRHRFYEEVHLKGFLAIRHLLKGFEISIAYKLMRMALQGKMPDCLWTIANEQRKLVAEKKTLIQNRLFTMELHQHTLPKKSMKVGEAAALANINPSAIRYWDSRGLIRSTREESSGYRIYTTEEIKKILLISSLRKSLYFIDDIEKIIKLVGQNEQKKLIRQFELAQDQLDQQLKRQLTAVAFFISYLEELEQTDSGRSV